MERTHLLGAAVELEVQVLLLLLVTRGWGRGCCLHAGEHGTSRLRLGGLLAPSPRCTSTHSCTHRTHPLLLTVQP